MKERLDYIFQRAEKDRKHILSLVGDLPDEKFFYCDGNRWSISQILTHIILSERISLQYMKKKSLGIKQVKNAGLWEDLKYLLLVLSQRLPLRYSAPKFLAEQELPKNKSFEKIEQDWQESRNQLRAFIDHLESGTLKKKIYKHPVSGRLSVLHAVDFFREHANHHLPQIKRLL
jgi:uncharacterized damage-inducible protein DinB